MFWNRKSEDVTPVIFGAITLDDCIKQTHFSVPKGPVLTFQDFLGYHLDREWLEARKNWPFPSFVEPRPSYRLRGRDADPVILSEHCNRTKILRTTFELLMKTETGRRVIKAVHDTNVILAIDPAQAAGEAVAATIGHLSETFTKGNSPHVIGLSREGADVGRANSLYHELRHVQQQLNYTAFQNEGNGYPNGFKGYGDQAYYHMVIEADAHGHSVINAAELIKVDSQASLQDIVKGFQSPLAIKIDELLSAGHSANSLHVKKELFNTWMTGCPEMRRHYELAQARVSCNDVYPHRVAGVSEFATKLSCIAKEEDGSSYLDEIDLRQAAYLGDWASISSALDLRDFADRRRKKVDIDYVNSQNKWDPPIPQIT